MRDDHRCTLKTLSLIRKPQNVLTREPLDTAWGEPHRNASDVIMAHLRKVLNYLSIRDSIRNGHVIDSTSCPSPRTAACRIYIAIIRSSLMNSVDFYGNGRNRTSITHISALLPAPACLLRIARPFTLSRNSAPGRPRPSRCANSSGGIAHA